MTTHDSAPTTIYDESATPLATSPPRTSHDQPFSSPDGPGDLAGSGDVMAASARGGVTHDDVRHDDAAREGGAQGGALIGVGLSAEYRTRWKSVQGDFIDEPRKAVTDADAMVGEVLQHLADTFREQRQTLEQGWADDNSSTEELRLALRRYRGFFDRLLSL